MPRMSRLRALALTAALAVVAALLVPATPAFAAGTTYTWLGGVSGLWTDAGNWSPNGVPGTGDSAVVNPPYDQRCNTHITGVPDGLELANLTVDEHAYMGNPHSACLTSIANGSITVDGSFVFHAGTIYSPVTLAAGATGTVTPNIVEDYSRFAGPVTVDGALTLTNNTGSQAVSLTGSPGITIAPGATLTTQGNNLVSANCCNDNAHLTNHGTISLGTGTLNLSGVELDQDAALSAPTGAELVTSVGPQTAGPGATWNGGGTWNMNYGDITVSGTQTLSGGFHWMLGGGTTTSEEYLHGVFSLLGTGTFDWAGGEIEAGMTLAHGITGVADGPAGVDGRFLEGVDAASGAAVAVVLHDPFAFTNGAGFSGGQAAKLTVASNAKLRLDPGTSLTGSYTLTNTGATVAVPAGAAASAPVTLGGAYRATGGTLSIGARSTVLTNGAAGSLSGTAVAGGGTFAVATPTTLTGTSTIAQNTKLVLEDDGQLRSSGTTTATLTGPGIFAWTGGELSGKLAFTTGAQNLSGSALKSVVVPTGAAPSAVSFAGPTSVGAGTSGTPDEIQSDARASLSFTGALTLNPYVELAGGTIATSGTTTVQAGAGEVDVTGVKFTNTGALAVTSGTFHLDANLTQTAGSTNIASGANITLQFSATRYALKGGTLAGTGTINGSVAGTGGALAPGGAGTIGTLTVTGSYTSTAHSALDVDLAAGSSDVLAVGGSATVAGTIVANDLGSYVPTAGTTATVLTGAPVTKATTCVQTTGAGAATEHWTAKVSGGSALVLTSVDGESPTC